MVAFRSIIWWCESHTEACIYIYIYYTDLTELKNIGKKDTNRAL